MEDIYFQLGPFILFYYIIIIHCLFTTNVLQTLVSLIILLGVV
jgi:hypothetical protein